MRPYFFLFFIIFSNSAISFSATLLKVSIRFISLSWCKDNKLLLNVKVFLCYFKHLCII